jgi:hypothetical protein
MIVEHRLHRLARLAKADPDKRFDRLFREITKTDFLMFAFEQIKDNPDPWHATSAEVPNEYQESRVQ